MKFGKLKSSVYMGLAATLTAMGTAMAPAAEAFQLVGTSATFDNAVLGDGTVVGSGGVAPSDDNLVEYLNVNGESQVRWGDAAYGTEQTTYQQVWQDGYYRGRGRRKRWVPGKFVTKAVTETVYTYENKSGLGFAGESNLDLNLGEAFNIGTLKHFNETIWSGTAAHKADFSLDLAFLESELGSQTFDFELNIDETLNSQEVCPYQTDAGKGCSDQITWSFAVDQANKFTYEGEEYEFQLVGFSEAELDSANIAEEFISQEGGTSEASLWAKIVKIDTNYNQTEIPEPGNMMGLGLASGAMILAAKRKKAAAEAQA